MPQQCIGIRPSGPVQPMERKEGYGRHATVPAYEKRLMTDLNRRVLLGGIAGAVGINAATASCAAGGAPPMVNDPTLAAVLRQLANLPSAIRTPGVASPDLAHLFETGAIISGSVGPGRLIVAHNPVRAIALVPTRLRGAEIDLPVIATFAGDAKQLRIISLSLSSDPFDVLRSPSSVADVTVGQAEDLQEHYDRLAAAGGGVLAIPPGLFATNLTLYSRNVHLSGAGRGTTRLTPRDPTQPVLRALYRDGSWSYVSIANLDIVGSGGRGTGFAAGTDSYVAGDELAGRTRFINVGFTDLSVAIRRPAGQLGLTLEQCGFGPADYHLHAVANPPSRNQLMHAGVMTVRDCHFTGARIAVAHIDSPVIGTGAVLFDNCIMERNPGFVFYVPAFADVEATTDFVVRDCWNELNATAAQIAVDGRPVPACYGFFQNAGMVRFEGTPLGPLILRNAVVETSRCPLDNLTKIEKDAASTIRHHEARGFGGYAPLGLATSVAAAAQSEPPARALSFVIPDPVRMTKVPSGKTLLSLRMDTPCVLVGTVSVATQSVPGAALPGLKTSQRLSLQRGMKLFPQPVPVPPESWVVWLFTYRLVSGEGPFFQVSGDRGISARRRLESPAWETLGGMAEVAPGAREISLWLSQEDDQAEVRLGGYNLLAFASRQSALDFLNSGIFALE